MAGTDKQQELVADGPAIILVEPQLGENIGMVARAMANFGLAELRLVNPRDGWPNEKAKAAAAKADHIIDAVRVFDRLEDAVTDLNYIFATTARPRDNFKPVRGPVEAAVELRARHSRGEKTGIFFGRERWGLTNEEIALADEIVTFPVNPAFASLNIAQAVLLMSYEWMKTQTVKPARVQDTVRVPAPKENLNSLMDYIDRVLSERGYFRTEAKKPKSLDDLRALFTRPGFTLDELTALRGVFSSLEKFTPKNPRGSGSPYED